MPIILPRRAFLAGLASALAAPAIVRASSLMPVKALLADINNPEELWCSYADLLDATRRAFLPRLFVQLYEDDPFVALLTPTTK